jgi:Sugar-binding cellulase-like
VNTPLVPEKLTITLWDFSWYTRTGPGQAFEDLDRAFAEAVERGYNTVRICAMPFLLFGSGLPTDDLAFQGLGGDYAQRTRWYDLAPSKGLDGRNHLVALFEAARRHDCYVILSSWEFQQSSSMSADRRWWDALRSVPPQDRTTVLADSLADMVDFLAERNLSDRIAFVELHNEVQLGFLADVLPAGTVRRVVGLRESLERGIDRFKARRPDVLVTVNYATVPVGELRGFPRNADVAVFHPYVYGVLDELLDVFALRDPGRPFPQELARRELLRAGAPDLDQWAPPAEDAWRLEATIVGQREVYVHDWCDPEKWDRRLYERYSLFAAQMATVLELWIDAAADTAARHNVPLVFGEGWVGYTPLHGRFEEGPVGAEICRRAARLSAAAGAWGTIVCSNAAPHHPMWNDVALQQEVNAIFRGTTSS